MRRIIQTSKINFILPESVAPHLIIEEVDVIFEFRFLKAGIFSFSVSKSEADSPHIRSHYAQDYCSLI
jgi:hypothetical protein